MKKTYIKKDEKFDEAIQKLKTINPGFNGSQLIRLAVIHMANIGMQVAFSNIESNTTEGVVKRKKAMPKESWCEMYGGSVSGGVCTIDKYETMPTGHVRRNKRVIALTAFPEDVDDFRKDILGHFLTVEEAETAYQAKPLV